MNWAPSTVQPTQEGDGEYVPGMEPESSDDEMDGGLVE